MTDIRNFSQMVDHLHNRGKRSRVVVVWGIDEITQLAIAEGIEAGFVEAVFVGRRNSVTSNAQLMSHADRIGFVEADDPDQAAAKAVSIVRNGGADVMMKGMINTDNLLRAILNKTDGMLPQGRILTHVTASEMPSYNKILFFTDAAVIPYPTPEQRAAQVRYIADAVRCFGITTPKVALIHCSEKVDERHFPFTGDYRLLAERAKNGEFGSCIVDGPLDVKTACNLAAMRKKHIDSPIAGEADALIFPDIESGNVFYKTITAFAGAVTAGALCGTMAPVVLPSRGDSVRSKFYSLALAAI